MTNNAVQNSVRELAASLVPSETLVRVSRHQLEPSDRYSVGHIVGAADALLALQRVSDRNDLDGYEILRLSDVTGLETDFSTRDVVERALALKSLSPKVPEGIDLSSIRSLLQSIGKLSQLIVIERERAAPDECLIGRLIAVTEESISLRLISPEAKWIDYAETLKLKDISRIQFGGEYEDTLAQLSLGG